MQKWTLMAGIMTVALLGALPEATQAAQTDMVAVGTAIVAPAAPTKVEATTGASDKALAHCRRGRGGFRRFGGRWW